MASREIENPYPQNQIIRGLPISNHFKKDFIEAIYDYMPQNGDVIINSYPKTGTMWMTYIVQQIMTRGGMLPTFTDMMTKVFPSLEETGPSAIDAMTTTPRFYRHHVPYNMVQKNLNTKIIYVFRKPEDVLISLYHFTRNWYLSLTLDQFFEDFLSGKVSFGRYFEHILSYLKHKDDGNILMVSYEKLVIQKKEEILKIAKFLGDDHYEVLSNDETVMHTIMEHINFDYMKYNLHFKFPGVRKGNPNFFRKGIVGDGKKALTAQQLCRLKKVAKETMKGTEILDEWWRD